MGRYKSFLNWITCLRKFYDLWCLMHTVLLRKDYFFASSLIFFKILIRITPIIAIVNLTVTFAFFLREGPWLPIFIFQIHTTLANEAANNQWSVTNEAGYVVPRWRRTNFWGVRWVYQYETNQPTSFSPPPIENFLFFFFAFESTLFLRLLRISSWIIYETSFLNRLERRI